uniref:Protein twisted gastrulation n=1 Tax=Strigamia maritima TaxID=126957 RepID=T1J4Z8_STRMM
MDKLHTFCILLLVGISQYILLASSSCNEAICASIVSKCMLTQSCKCDLKNCTCCRDCFSCLDDLYYECCSCVEMCPKSNDSDVSLSKNSHVGELPEKIPDLFNALTEEQDRQMRWLAVTYPIHLDVSFFSPKLDREIKMIAVSSSSSQDVDKYEEAAVNCTVAFMSQCMSWNKCKRSCESMGASSYRWFHDGCCECIGDTCLNYGINVSKCQKCSSEEQAG